MTSPRPSITLVDLALRQATILGLGLTVCLSAGCTFNDRPLTQRACTLDNDCQPEHRCLDGYCRQPALDAASDNTTSGDLVDLADEDSATDTTAIDTHVAPRNPALARLEAEVTPAVVAPGRRWTTTLTLRVERGEGGGTDLLLVGQPPNLVLDLDTLEVAHDERPLDLTARMRDGDEIQLALAEPLPDGLVTLTADVEVGADADAVATWTIHALATTAGDDDVDAVSADTDAIAGNSDGLEQEVRRLFADARAELVPMGPGFGPTVFVAASALETHGIHDAGASRGTLFVTVDQPHVLGVDHLTLVVEPSPGQATATLAPSVLAVRVDGVPRPIVDADPDGLEVTVTGDDTGTVTLTSASAWVDQDADARLDVEIDLDIPADDAARASLALTTWLGEAPDIVEPIAAGDATGLGSDDALDIEVWAWTSRYEHDFSADADHTFATDGNFDGWSARAGGNGAALVRDGTLLVRNWLYEAAGTTLVYRAVPGYAGGALRIAAELAVQPYHDVVDHSPGGTSFYFGAFANESAIVETPLNGHHTTPPLGYGAWVYSGYETERLVSGHWGIVDTTAPNHMSGVLAGSDLASPSTFLDWDPTGVNVRSLVAVFGADGQLAAWLFDPAGAPPPAPQMHYDPGLAPVHDADGMVFFAMTDEGDLAVSQVRIDELVAPPPAP